MQKNFTLVSYDDWQALYLNGNVVTQDHQVRTDELIESLKDGYDTFEEHFYENNEYMEEEGQFPDKLKDIPDLVLTKEEK